MSNTYFPDISAYQGDMSIKGASAIMVKATEDGGSTGDRYINPFYKSALAQADTLGIPKGAYHFLRKDDEVAEADFAFSVIGAGIATMIDAEASKVTPDDVLSFSAEFRRLGGIVSLCYLPEWYWGTIGNPSLLPLQAEGIHIVSSGYPTSGYSDNGEGWTPYGGVTPVHWQYTDKQVLNGMAVDYNAFKGTIVELHDLWYPGSIAVPTPAIPTWPGRNFEYIKGHSEMTGGDVLTWQRRMQVRGWTISADSQYGQKSAEVCLAFQKDSTAHGYPLAEDSQVGLHTWSESWARPIS